MRLFHYALIPVLDNKHLVAQWRECIAIKRQWEKGTLKHRLVSYVMDYDKKYFFSYIGLVTDEMFKRNINFNIELFEEMQDFCKPSLFNNNFNLYYPEHNDRYLKQCYYNLQEKYDRGIISYEEWELIHKNIYGQVISND